MSSRKRFLPSFVTRFPWWCSVLMAIASYILLKYLASALALSAGYASIGGFLAYLAPIASIAFLFLAAILLYDEEPGLEQQRPSTETTRRSDEDSENIDAY